MPARADGTRLGIGAAARSRGPHVLENSARAMNTRMPRRPLPRQPRRTTLRPAATARAEDDASPEWRHGHLIHGDERRRTCRERQAGAFHDDSRFDAKK